MAVLWSPAAPRRIVTRGLGIWSQPQKFGNLILQMKVRRKNRGQTMTEYALILAAVAVVAYGLSPTSGYNFLDDAITGLLGKVISLL